MMIMLRILGRRWWGISGWGYLFSLLLAAGVYWWLTPSRAVHQWSFPGVAYVVGFVDQDRALLVKQLRHDSHGRHIIDLHTGYIHRDAEPESSKNHDLTQTKRVPFVLSESGSLLPDRSGILELKDQRNGSVRVFPSFKNVEFGGGVAYGGGRYSSHLHLSNSGPGAMSENGRWLLMAQQQPRHWNRLLAWLRQKTGWSWPLGYDGMTYLAIVVDLLNDEYTSFVLSTQRAPHFEIHPNGTGFAVVDINLTSTPVPDEQNEGHTMIEWYSLPVGPAYHSLTQWGIIAGVFVASILLFKWRFKAVAPRV